MKNIIITCCLLCLMIPVYAQQNLTISGTVYDERGDALPGASIYLKDRPGLGVISDIDGHFSIRASRGDMIVFSFMDMKTSNTGQKKRRVMYKLSSRS